MYKISHFEDFETQLLIQKSEPIKVSLFNVKRCNLYNKYRLMHIDDRSFRSQTL